MDALDYIFKKAPPTRQLTDDFTTLYAEGLAIEPPLSPEQLLYLAEEIAVHAACIQAKADDIAGRGWQIETEDETEADQTLELLEQITPDLPFDGLLRQAAWELEAVGWGAWEVVRLPNGQIGAIYPLPAHTLRATRDPNRFVQLRGGKSRTFASFGTATSPDESEVIVFRYYSPRSPFYGLPRWIGALPSLAELVAIREYNISWFESGGMTDRIIQIVAPSPDTALALSDHLRLQFTSSKGRGHTSAFVATSKDVELQIHSLAPNIGRREGQFLTRRDAIIKEVLMAHGVPPYRIGLAELGSLGGSAAREMLSAYRIGVVEPGQQIFESKLAQTLFGPRGLALKGRWRLADVSWEETELNLEIATRGVQFGLLTPNEARTLMGRPPVPDPALDQYYLATNLTPLATGAEAEVAKAIDVIEEFKRALEAAISTPAPQPPAPQEGEAGEEKD